MGANPAAGAIVLIGMPGAGKSTIGALLAQHLSLPFIDTDALIERSAGVSLQQLVDSRGVDTLRSLEEQIICALPAARCVIATGGSAVYGEAAMVHLRSLGVVVWLQLDLPELTQRLVNFAQRGLARRPEQSLADLYHERQPLYRRHADIAIDCAGKAAAALVPEIVTETGRLTGHSGP